MPVAASGVLLLAACTTPTTNETSAPSEPSIVACQVSDNRGLLDVGPNAAVADALTEATKTLGAKTMQVEAGNPADYAASISSLTGQGCDVVIGVGQGLKDPLQAEAAVAPEQKFIIVDAAFTDADGKLTTIENGKSIQFAAAEGGYLAGFLAAGLTTSGTVGVLGGTDTTSTKAAMDGFVDGVAGYNAANATQVNVLGWDKATQAGIFTGDPVDAVTGQLSTQPLLDQGADVIMPVGGPFGAGTLAAAAAKEGTSVIWFGGRGSDLPANKELVAGSVVFGIKPVVGGAIKKAADAEFHPEPFVGTVKNEGITVDLDVARVKAAPRDLGTQLDDVKAKLAAGEIVVETTNGPIAP